MGHALPSYELRKALPSCFVSRQLLLDLEIYLLSQSGELPDSCKGRRYEVFLEDRLGTETLDSADRLRQQRFPDDTKGVRMELYAHTHDTKSDWEHLTIRLSFGRTPLDSRAHISFTGLKAREYVVGLWAGIARISGSHRTMRSWVHFPRVFCPAAVALTFGVLLGAAFRVQFGYVFAVVVPYAFLATAMGAVRYCAFDTRSHET